MGTRLQRPMQDGPLTIGYVVSNSIYSIRLEGFFTATFQYHHLLQITQIAYLEEYQLVKEQSGMRIGDKTCYIEVFDLDRDAASLEKCAKEVANKPSCGNAFFFRKNKGRCICEKHGFTCMRQDNTNVNEYILTAG